MGRAGSHAIGQVKTESCQSALKTPVQTEYISQTFGYPWPEQLTWLNLVPMEVYTHLP